MPAWIVLPFILAIAAWALHCALRDERSVSLDIDRLETLARRAGAIAALEALPCSEWPYPECCAQKYVTDLEFYCPRCRALAEARKGEE